MAKKLLRYIAFTSMQIVLIVSLNSWSPIHAESYNSVLQSVATQVFVEKESVFGVIISSR